MDQYFPENERALAADIVKLVVEDYKAACEFYKKHKKIIQEYGVHRRRFASAYNFLTSESFCLYTNIDKDEMLDYLEEKYGEFKDV